MYLLHKNKKLAHEKRMVEKTLRGWVGFTNWGVRLFICGGDRAQGGLGCLSELPKSSFFNEILIRNRSFGRCFFFLGFWRLEFQQMDQKSIWSILLPTRDFRPQPFWFIVSAQSDYDSGWMECQWINSFLGISADGARVFRPEPFWFSNIQTWRKLQQDKLDPCSLWGA